MKLRKQREAGYTILETMIVLAIVGLMTLLLLTGFSNNSRVERFSGEVRQFKSSIIEAQTSSYATEVGDPGACSSNEIPAGGTGCFWRGNVVEFSSGSGTYSSQLLFGNDLSAISSNTDQRRGIIGKQPQRLYRMGENGVIVEKIIYDPAAGNNCQNTGGNTGKASIVFLAPDARRYTDSTIRTSYSLELPAYYDTRSIIFCLRDQATNLSAMVTYNPLDGTIESEVR